MQTTDIYRHMSQEHDRYLYWSEAGWARYCSIVGYCHALDMVTGEDRIGSKLLAKLHDRIDQLKRTDDTTLDGKLNRAVPATKLVLHDDGCLHSFGFAYFVPVEPHADKWRLYAANAAAITEADRLNQPICAKSYDPLLLDWQDNEPDSTLVGLCDVNRHRWVAPIPHERIRDSEGNRDMREYSHGDYDAAGYTGYVRYRYRYNGGLIYHGESSDIEKVCEQAIETGYGSNPWSIHT